MPATTRIKMGQTYKVNGTDVTITRVAWGFQVRDENEELVGERSTRKAATKLAAKVAKAAKD